jgi:hypothetical protein
VPAESICAAHSTVTETSARPVPKSSLKERLHDPTPTQKRPCMGWAAAHSPETGSRNVRWGSDPDVTALKSDFRFAPEGDSSPTSRQVRDVPKPNSCTAAREGCSITASARPSNGRDDTAGHGDQLLCKTLAVLDASGTADGFNNLGGRNIMDKIS